MFVTAAGLAADTEARLEIRVIDNNVEKAIKILKRQLIKEGVFRQLKERRWAEKPSDRRRRKERQAARRLRRQVSRARARRTTRH
jgi:small subunit ribosomal protein S21